MSAREPIMKRLRDITWKVGYRQSDGDLLHRFYIPALERAVSYDRMTGYFSAQALSLAARGIQGLINNGGKMRLIVGCTLEADEIEALEAAAAWKRGLRDDALNAVISEKMKRIQFDLPNENAKDGLGALAFMVASDLLDIRVAVPIDPNSNTPVVSPGLYHEKVGIIRDFDGDTISFSGSVNETAAGWRHNRESFHVHKSWIEGESPEHVAYEVEAFRRIWENQDNAIWTMAFPEAQKQRLLEFLPNDDRLAPVPVVSPEKDNQTDDQNHDDLVITPPDDVHRLTNDEIHQIVWTYIANAAKMKNGVRVGEVTSTVTPWPHQLRSFVRMWDSWPFRMLESSEVGLGKTIVAGLVIRQAWLAGRAKRILLLVPKAVMSQWQAELYEKFNLNVPVYDGKALTWVALPHETDPPTRTVSRVEWIREPIVLASSHLMRRKDRRQELLQQDVCWDLVVLDEAHHARRRGAGTAQEKGPNALLTLMKELATKTPSLLLLTATPMQVHPVEVYDLLSLLGMPKQWDSASFIRYFEQVSGNPDQHNFEWLVGMFRAYEETYGQVSEEDATCVLPQLKRLKVRRLLRDLRDPSQIARRRMDADMRGAALSLLQRFTPVRELMSRHTRSLLRRYYEEGLLSSPIARRNVDDVLVPLSAGEREVYERVEDYISTTYNNTSKEKKNAVGFVMTIYRRRLASSFYALKSTLRKRLTNIEPFDVDEDVSQNELVDEIPSSDDVAALADEAARQEELDDLRELLKMIERLGPQDSKAKALVAKLQEHLSAGYDSAIIFTQYTDTMQYLADYLAEHLPELPIGTYSGKGGRIRTHSGDWTTCSKEQIKRALKAKRIKLLIATDAAGEGLNLQFCGVLGNYDLPWNPMKVEQRIGRIDRIGQVHEEIRIINFGYKDTVEADVYFSLGNRINLFQGIVGKLQPILSRLPEKFESLTFVKPEQREFAKQQFLSEIENQIKEAEDSGFDVDAVANESLNPPNLPEPSLRPEWIEVAMNTPGVLPAGWKWRPLDQGSYGLTVPGQPEIRVATRAEVFDDHPESMAFFGPGLVLFDAVAAPHSDHESSDINDLYFGKGSFGYECFTKATDGSKCAIESLSQLLHVQISKSVVA